MLEKYKDLLPITKIEICLWIKWQRSCVIKKSQNTAEVGSILTSTVTVSCYIGAPFHKKLTF